MSLKESQISKRKMRIDDLVNYLEVGQSYIHESFRDVFFQVVHIEDKHISVIWWHLKHKNRRISSKVDILKIGNWLSKIRKINKPWLK